MTAQTASTPHNNPLRPLAHTMRMANVITDVAVTLGGLGVTPAGIGIDTLTALYGAAFGVSVNITGKDTAAVDMIATELDGIWHEDAVRNSNYTQVGMVRFGGELIRIRVYTGRPTGGAL